MAQTLVYLEHQVVKCSFSFQNYEEDEGFTQQLSEVVKKYACEVIISFDFFPLLAKIAENFHIKYVSWIYDCPNWTLYSPSAKSVYNYVFVFDRVQYQELKNLGIPHLYHFPLAVNTRRLSGMLEFPWECGGTDNRGAREAGTDSLGTREEYPVVSFVGSLYEKNFYDQIQFLPQYLKGYLEGAMQAQQRVYGYHFISELLTEDILNVMEQYVSMDLPNSYPVSKKGLYTAMLNSKITSNERIALLNQVSRICPLTLYTASDMSRVPDARAGGTVGYQKEMPQIFCHSKINLNLTLRSIQSGIPLRALDIMGAGGFLLSNYQPELAEQFEDGRELALFGSQEELLDKIMYYLSHEEERLEVARRGFQKVQRLFAYEVRVKQMLELVESASGIH